MSRSLPETLCVITNRYSCRAYLPEPLPAEDEQLLLESLRQAPSAGNRQPWHFYLVKNRLIKEKLVRAAGGQQFLAEAPLVFVVCAIPEISAERYGERGRTLYVYQDTAAAVENLLLAATALGYGSCWVGAFNEEEVSQILNLPGGYRPVAMVPVGKPAEPATKRPRNDFNKIVTILE